MLSGALTVNRQRLQHSITSTERNNPCSRNTSFIATSSHHLATWFNWLTSISAVNLIKHASVTKLAPF